MSLVVKSPLESLSDAHEAAGDEWRLAIQLEAEKENEFRRKHAIAWLQASGENIAITARAKHCENQPDVVEAKCEWNLAIARKVSCHSKVEEIQSRIMATMSNNKYMGRADGGF
jgi:hypothetical protein